MPFRNAHWWVLATFPLIGLAFWRGYLSVLQSSPIEFHLHGISATLWLLLVVAQSWSIHHGHRSFHRVTGLLSFALFPLFLAGGVIILIAEAGHFVERASPFYRLYPPPLAWVDFVSVGAMAAFYFLALKYRRNSAKHAGYLLATVIFLLPPVLGRLAPIPLGIDLSTPAGFDDLGQGFHAGNIAAALISFVIAWRSGRNGRPFMVAGALMLLASVLFEYPGRSAWWFDYFGYVAELAWVPTALISAIVGAAIGWAGWVAGQKATIDQHAAFV